MNVQAGRKASKAKQADRARHSGREKQAVSGRLPGRSMTRQGQPLRQGDRGI
jgi:hypothetical protein